jgi:hypothetical protein
MANFTISGNVGGVAGAGTQVQLETQEGDIFQTFIADASGNFTFTIPDLRTYVLTAIPTGTPTCRIRHQVIMNGGNISNVNFQISALNSDNRGPLGF